MLRITGLAILACSLGFAVKAQSPPPAKPGPEHAILKANEGIWDVVQTKSDGTNEKGEFIARMDCGGFCIASELTAELKDGRSYRGKGLVGYDPAKKKYVGIWISADGKSPTVSEGTYDESTKTRTHHAEIVGPDGKVVKYKDAIKHIDADHFTMQSSVTADGGKETKLWTFEFTRRKK